MGQSTVHAFSTELWYDLTVHDVSVDLEAGVGRSIERVAVEFLAAADRPCAGHGAPARGRPKARIAMNFNSDRIPRDHGTRRLLEALGVPIPVPADFDWEKTLAGRRVAGRFDPPPRSGAHNPLGDARPAGGRPAAEDPGPQVADRYGASGRSVFDDRVGDPPRPVPPGEAGAGRPRWAGDLRSLTWGGRIVASYGRSAPNQAKILSAFEEEGWPPKIDDPLDRGILRQTLKDLQKKFLDTPIAFVADGTGEGIRWSPRGG